MRVFLAGATGAIGRRLVPMLIAEGHEVTGMTRSPEKAEELHLDRVPSAWSGALSRFLRGVDHTKRGLTGNGVEIRVEVQ